MLSSTEIKAVAAQLLDFEPPPVVRFRLLRDVLDVRVTEAELEQISESSHVQDLARQQKPDGGWGAFHSRSAGRPKGTASTEVALERAVSLGLEAGHPVLLRAKQYLISILRGERPFPDRPEKNDRWPTGTRLFTASTLSLIEPDHPELEHDRLLWRRIASAAFQSGNYSEDDEAQAHANLTGASVRGSYLRINNRYSLNILGSRSGLLQAHVEAALLDWLWELPGGIGYLGVPLARIPGTDRPGPLDRWLASLEMMVRLFPLACRHATSMIEWLWSQRRGDGLWDFGPRAPSSTSLPLADNWRARGNRVIDWSTRVLLLSAMWARSPAPGGNSHGSAAS